MIIPRVMLAAFASGSGKTTLTCAILQALVNRHLKTAAFKCGPDYIDPMFHSEVIGAHSRNLDIFMLGEQKVLSLLAKNTTGNDIAVFEGVMGYYDGLYATDTASSSYDVARLTKTPVVLVVNGGGMSLSLGALVKGFTEFKEDSNIKGVILNNVSEKSYQFYKKIIEEVAKLPVLGYLPKLPEAALESRHLGLITAQEVQNLKEKMSVLAQNAEQFIDIDALIKLAHSAPEINSAYTKTQKIADVRIAIARDKAFSFYYEDGLDVLGEMGAELVAFSPLVDKKLPKCDGLIIGGGYPEIYARELQDNHLLRADIKEKIANGLPAYAECGGFMYLLDKLVTKQNETFDMCGVINGQSSMNSSFKQMGYATITCQKDNFMCDKDTQINIHEFHSSVSSNDGNVFRARKINGESWDCIHAEKNVFCGYPHIHFYGAPTLAENFIKAAQGYNLAQYSDK